jgi:hypothetical protein
MSYLIFIISLLLYTEYKNIVNIGIVLQALVCEMGSELYFSSLSYSWGLCSLNIYFAFHSTAF